MICCSQSVSKSTVSIVYLTMLLRKSECLSTLRDLRNSTVWTQLALSVSQWHESSFIRYCLIRILNRFKNNCLTNIFPLKKILSSVLIEIALMPGSRSWGHVLKIYSVNFALPNGKRSHKDLNYEHYVIYERTQ